MHLSLRSRHLVLAAVSTGLLVLVATRPELAGQRVADAVDGLGAANPQWLWAAGAAFAVMHVLAGLSWRSALGACGTHTGRRDAVARYGVGSGLNAVTPAHLGSVARLALFARVVEGDGGVWRVGGAGAAVGAVRCVWLALVIAVAAAVGAVPAWPVVILAAVLILAVATALGSRRLRCGRRIGHLCDAFRELGRRPRALLTVAALTAGGMAAKLAAAAAIALALGVERPFLAALVVVPAVALAAAMPVTPGNVGVASAAAALALGATGLDGRTALSIGIAFAGVETLAAVAVGAMGCLVLCAPAMRPIARVAAASTATVAVTCAYGATVLLPLL